jgi:hypothetical protein
MHNVMRNSMSHQSAVFRAGSRVPLGLSRMWTGRARVSATTNTLIPRCVATTTHRTRVSEMRTSSSRLQCAPLSAAHSSAEILTSKRRDSGSLLHSSG